jgi:DNA-binding LytR/AlgR family response regulator
MHKIKIAIVEDEALIAIRLSTALEDLGYTVCETASNYSEGLDLILAEQPDLLISDIELSGRKTGIDLAQKVREFSSLPIIFLTSYNDKETIDFAREARPNAYLIKPFNKEELYSAIEIAMMNHRPIHQAANEPKFHFIKVKDAFEKIGETDIAYVSSDHVYLELYTLSKKRIVIRKSLTEFMEELSDDFVRIHKSHAVNLRHVSKVSTASVTVNDIELPLGKSYKNDFMDALKNNA